jgi:hypothetical protein
MEFIYSIWNGHPPEAGMAKVTTSISCEADRRYVRALALVAERESATSNQKLHTGSLVRHALDKVYGKKIKEALNQLDSILPMPEQTSSERNGGAA